MKFSYLLNHKFIHNNRLAVVVTQFLEWSFYKLNGSCYSWEAEANERQLQVIYKSKEGYIFNKAQKWND